jgi:ABC-type transport system substrate-binding protein
MAEFLQAQLAEVGIALELIPMDWGASNAAEREGGTDVRHRGLTWAVGGSYYGIRSGFHSSMSARASIHFSSDFVDHELEQWEKASPDTGTGDRIAGIEREIAREHAFVPLYFEREVIAVGPRIADAGGFATPMPDTYPVDLSGVTLQG